MIEQSEREKYNKIFNPNTKQEDTLKGGGETMTYEPKEGGGAIGLMLDCGMIVFVESYDAVAKYYLIETDNK